MALSLKEHTLTGIYYAYGQIDAGNTAPGVDAQEFGERYAARRQANDDGSVDSAPSVQDAWKEYLDYKAPGNDVVAIWRKTGQVAKHSNARVTFGSPEEAAAALTSAGFTWICNQYEVKP